MNIYYGNNDWRDYNYLAHHGILGQKWGVRRFQNPDGTLTSAGKKRYSIYEEGEGPSLITQREALLSRASFQRDPLYNNRGLAGRNRRNRDALDYQYRAWADKTHANDYKEKISGLKSKLVPLEYGENVYTKHKNTPLRALEDSPIWWDYQNTKNRAKALLKAGYTWSEVADAVGVSEATLRG